jgi:hypothetical protein
MALECKSSSWRESLWPRARDSVVDENRESIQFNLMRLSCFPNKPARRGIFREAEGLKHRSGLLAGSGFPRCFAALLTLAACLACPLNAVEILSSVPDNNSPTISYVPGYGIGFPFASGAQQTTVTSLTIGYGDTVTGASIAGPEAVVLKIYSADGADARPGTVLGEFVFSSKEGSYATFVPSTASVPGAELLANGNFWIAIFNKGAAGSFFPYTSVMEGANLTYSGLAGYAFTGGELTSSVNEDWPAPVGTGNNRRIRVAMNGDIYTPPPPPPPPPLLPTVNITGGAKVKITTAKVTIKGSSTNATRVEVKVGSEPFKTAGGTAKDWTTTLRVKLGKTVVQVRAIGPGGTSPLDKVTIVRKKPGL